MALKDKQLVSVEDMEPGQSESPYVTFKCNQPGIFFDPWIAFIGQVLDILLGIYTVWIFTLAYISW